MTFARSLPPNAFAASASLICWGSSGNWSPALIEQAEKSGRGQEIVPARVQSCPRLCIVAPLLELPAIVEGDRFPGRLDRHHFLEDGQPGDQGTANRHQRR